MTEEKYEKRRLLITILFILSFVMIFAGTTYAFIEQTLVGTKKQVITAGTLSLELQEDENNLTIQGTHPMYDEVGMIQKPFTFRLVNKGSASANYIIKLVEIGTGNLTKSDAKYGLTKDGVATIDLVSNIVNGAIDSGNIAGGATIHYTLRLWIRDGVTDISAIKDKSLSYKIDVEVSQ